MQTICDGCSRPARNVGKLSKVIRRGLSRMLCKECRRKEKLSGS